MVIIESTLAKATDNVVGNNLKALVQNSTTRGINENTSNNSANRNFIKFTINCMKFAIILKNFIIVSTPQSKAI